jgi:DNA-binding NarL/FixJ family response regulator
MPNMNGWELSKAFRELYSDVKVIFMSGYTDDIIGRHGLLHNEEVLLQKPLRPSLVARVIREVLDGRCPVPGLFMNARR